MKGLAVLVESPIQICNFVTLAIFLSVGVAHEL